MNSDIYLYVTNIISRGNYNSAIMSGYEVDQDGNILSSHKKVRVKATGKALNQTSVYVGQTWHIIDSVEESYIQNINGFTKSITQLNATTTKLHSKAGDNFIAFISGNENFKGVGLTKARKLWVAYGENIYSLLSSGDVDELKKVISKQAAVNMIEVWRTEGCYTSLVWLDENNIPSDIGIEVVDYYKNQTKEKISEDPYRLIAFCASWKSVDKLALHTFNIPSNDIRRMNGAIEDALYSSYSTKNTALSSIDLKQKIKARLLPLDADGNVLDTVESQKDALSLANLALENIEGNGSYYKSKELYHPAGAYLMEQYIAEEAKRLSNKDVSNIIPIDDVLSAIAEYESINKDDLPTGLADAQKQAVISSVYSPLLLISGGAGTGKTTVLRCIYYVLEKHGTDIVQMALAGRAAKRMQDATDKDAYTIAGYLKAYEDDPDRLLGDTCIVVDESSMVDLLLAYRVMKTMSKNCRLIMVGDPVQLAPIGPGLIFHLLVKTKGIEHVELTDIKRQKDSTGIPLISKSIRNHVWPTINSYTCKCDGVSINQCGKSFLRDSVISIFDELGGCNDDTRIIAPTYSHPSGVTQLNQLCQEKYRKADKHVSYWDDSYECNINTGFKVNDYVMWLNNDYSRDLRNGSLGVIKDVLDGEGGYVCNVDFEGNELKLKVEDMVKETLTLAYAITAHKAQGSQFDRVIIPIYQWSKLDQSWIYTALTRSVKQAVFVGDIKYAEERVLSKSSADNRTVGLETLLQLSFNNK